MIELTNEERARIFAMYWGCEFIDDGWLDSKKMLYPTECPDTCKLLLTPLSKITDEHAVEVIGIQSKIYQNIKISDQYRGGKGWGFSYEFEYASSRRRRIQGINWSSLTPLQFQYLISKSYAVPLWFAIDHPANNKTAIELGLAIDKTLS